MICVPIIANSQNQACKDIAIAVTSADVIELRLDMIANGNVSTLVKAIRSYKKKNIKILLTNRLGIGETDLQKEKRLASFREAISLGVDYVDIEIEEGEKTIKIIRNLISRYKGRTILIVSHHGFLRTPSERHLKEIFHKCDSVGAQIVKIVCLALSAEDNLKIFRLIPYALKKDKQIIAFCMGEAGRISRLVSPTLGSKMSYIALRKDKASATGQFTLNENKILNQIIGHDFTAVEDIDSKKCCISQSLKMGDAKLFAVFGNPVAHSLSPLMHNSAFAKMQFNGVYIPVCVDDIAVATKAIKAMGIRGVSVTIPFKSVVMEFLDKINIDAQAIGAVNTIINNNGTLVGYNTDWIGAMMAIEEQVMLKGKRIAIIGAGGVARAICFGAVRRKAIPIIINRNIEKGLILSKHFNCDFVTADKINEVRADIIVNATPIGMMPNNNVMPLSKVALKNFKIVMDTVYNPIETMLITEAKKIGLTTISGMEMFIHQGAEQFKIMTGLLPPIDLMRQVVKEALSKN
ncbi:MAG: shikimate dehydrogenase [Deltaproteobacteria bacterium]